MATEYTGEVISASEYNGPVLPLGGAPLEQTEAAGPLQSLRAGYQSSVTGLAFRQKLPDLVMNPQHAKWWERAIAGTAQIVGDLPAMIPGGMAGGALGTVAGGAAGSVVPVVGNVSGAAAGGLLGAGAGMMGTATAVRESLMQAYKSGDAVTPEDWWNILRDTARDAAVGAVTFGAGGVAARTVGKAIAPSIGQSIGVGTATKAIGTADVAAQIATMTTMPAAFQGRLPTAQEFLDGAIIIGGMKAAHVVAPKIADIFVRTGKTPAEVVADAKVDPTITLDVKPVEAPSTVEPMVTVYHGSPHTFEAFDVSKIGTGEGAQAFGHGLYFAESSEVATGYRRDNALFNAAEVRAHTEAVAALRADKTDGLNKMASDAIEAARDDFRHFDKREASNEELAQYLEDGIIHGQGAVYRVEIPQRVVDSMLDWDKPLSEQPANVQAAIKASQFDIPAIAKLGGVENPTGRQLYGAFQQIAKEGKTGTSADASELMRQAGIPGIRYLDQGSRAKGEGTRNFVLFDAQHARVIERNGETIASKKVEPEPPPRAYQEAAQANTVASVVPDAMTSEKHALNIAAVLSKPFGEVPVEKLPNYLNFDYVEGPQDMKAVSARISEIFEQQIDEARGKESWDATRQKAEDLLIAQARAGGQPLTIPQDYEAFKGMAARGMATLAMSQRAAYDVAAKAREIEKNGATEENSRALVAAIETSALMQAADQGTGAEIARALNARKAARQTGELAQQMQDLFAKYNKDPLTLAKMIGELGTPEKINQFAKNASKATAWEKLVEGWKAFLLSGPVTHTTNLFGTGAFQVLRVPVDALASGVGMLRGAKVGMGESDRIAAMEPLARLTGYLGGTLDALKVGYHTLKVEEPPGGKTESYKLAIEGRKGQIIRIPLRLMAAEDAIVSTMYQRGELKTLAMRQAIGEGMNPLTREFAERMDQLTDNPTEAMRKEVATQSTRMTFNAPLGEKGVALQNFVKKWGLQWMIPFIRTPIDIAKELARMSPLAPLVGEWRADMAKGGVARDRAIAEVALGSAVMTATAAYAFSGSISGAGSPDPGKNKAKAGVWQPYSVLIGDKWYEYQRIQPLGTLMGMAADMANIWDHMSEEERDKVPKMVAVAFANAITNQTFLQGITNVVNAVSDPNRYGAPFIRQLAGTVVPNVIAQPTAMADPYTREVNSVLDAIKARIPGMRQQLPAKVDWLGEKILTKERLGVIAPVRTQEVSQDKVRTEAARLDISVADAPKKTHLGRGTGKIGDVELTQDERTTFATVGGQLAHVILTGIVNQPNWDPLPDLKKRRIYQKVLTQSHVAGAAAALSFEKRNAYLQEITEKMQQALTPEEVTQ